MKTRIMAIVWAILITITFHNGCQRSATEPKEGTPEHAVILLEKYLREGDSDAHFKLMPKGLQELVERLEKQNADYDKASDVFNDAIEARFGQGCSAPWLSGH